MNYTNCYLRYQLLSMDADYNSLHACMPHILTG